MNALIGKTIVLIVGQPKAGTTSLFDWMSQHPQIAAGKLKELRFFLDPEYPLQSPLRFDGTNLNEYLTLFNHPERSVLLDASPDYFGCDAPLRLPQLHNDAKAIILTRDPLERMISAYRFFRSGGLLPSDMSFDGYIEKQHTEGVIESTPVQYRALDHCRAGHYKSGWYDAYGDKLLVVDFDDLRSDPQRVLNDVFDFIGIDRLERVSTDHKNKTQSYRSPTLYRLYSGVRRWLRVKTLKYPALYKAMRPVGRLLLRGLKSSDEEKTEIQVSDRTRSQILQAEALD